MTWEKLGYQPHKGQETASRSEARVVVVAGAERGGKSQWAGNEVVARYPWCTRAGRIAVAADEYDECHAEMEYIIEGLRKLGALVGASRPQQGKWVAKAKGGVTIETVSLHNGPDELTGTGDAFDLVLLVEAGLIRYDCFLAAVMRVAETRGTVFVVGTLKDNFGWHADLYRDCEGENVYGGERFSFPAWLNRAVFPGGRADPEIVRLEQTLPRSEFLRRVAAELVADPARIYPEFDHIRHVGTVEWDRDQPVILAVDAGYYPSRYAVLALQVVEETFKVVWGSQVRMSVVHQIDEVWENHLTHQDVWEMCKEREWWTGVEKVVLGHEGTQHQAAASTEEVWNSLARAQGKELKVEVFDAGRIMDGVVRVKTFLRDPALKVARYRVDARCTGTISEFGAWRRPVDSKHRVRSDEPEDRNNDAMDALRNFMVWKFGLVEAVRKPSVRGRRRRVGRG